MAGWLTRGSRRCTLTMSEVSPIIRSSTHRVHSCICPAERRRAARAAAQGSKIAACCTTGRGTAAHRLSRKVLARPRRRHVWQAALAVDRLCCIDPVTLMSSRATFGLRAYPQRFGNTREVARCRAVVTVGGSRLTHCPQITVCDCLSRAYWYSPELPVLHDNYSYYD